MKRKKRKLTKKRRNRSKKRIRVSRVRKNRRKYHRTRVRKSTRVRKRRMITDPRIAHGLAIMRRKGVSASVAARLERMKLETFRKGAGRYLYRSGPGKPWKARSEDQLRLSLTILTINGPLDVIVFNSRERKILNQYNFALRMFRAAEDGAEVALKAFEGKKVGGHVLITNIKLLTELEEAGELDRVENMYTAIGARS